MNSCHGHGNCLNHIGSFHCSFNCRPFKCSNFLLCGQVEPLYLLEKHGGRCSFCDSVFQKNLEFYSSKEVNECPVCMDESKTILVKLPRCKHYICCSCFRTIYVIHDLSSLHQDRKIDMDSSQKRCPICRAVNSPQMRQ